MKELKYTMPFSTQKPVIALMAFVVTSLTMLPRRMFKPLKQPHLNMDIFVKN